MTQSGEIIRASNRDRKAAIRALRGQMRDGRLSEHTFVMRLRTVIAARNRTEVSAAMADLTTTRGRFRRLLGRLDAWLSTPQAAVKPPDPIALIAFPPVAGAYVIGRIPEAQFRIEHDSVSRRHAVLTHTDGGWTISDLGSRNGTWINGWRISAPAPVRVGDLVHFGTRRFVIVERETVTRSWTTWASRPQ